MTTSASARAKKKAVDAGATPTSPGRSKRSLAPSSSTRGYDAVRLFVIAHLARELASSGSTGLAKSAKSKLQEAVQAQGFAPPVYEIVSVSGKDHAREFTAEVLVDGTSVGRGTGTRKSHAEQAAAAEALTAMGLG